MPDALMIEVYVLGVVGLMGVLCGNCGMLLMVVLCGRKSGRCFCGGWSGERSPHGAVLVHQVSSSHAWAPSRQFSSSYVDAVQMGTISPSGFVAGVEEEVAA